MCVVCTSPVRLTHFPYLPPLTGGGAYKLLTKSHKFLINSLQIAGGGRTQRAQPLPPGVWKVLKEDHTQSHTHALYKLQDAAAQRAQPLPPGVWKVLKEKRAAMRKKMRTAALLS